ncbi:hydrolase [Erwinia amylovora]|uniref:Abhydrolase domain-containing protein 1 n=1 Tax=Erwinia amylovora ATCC BAA-2158 TaxID=889211 RepID=E5BA01_ERWAM|nr:hydrolase [Erwinia amylovora]MBZ2398170.1 hydrolase [Erwinia amylovora]MBZ2401600.1 hydrolase [Erwinia amylovora]CBX82308.1 Abhydrolase domain-containing protein 1 [Erwinia amylovora ATCC BAA-2158]
MDPTSSDHMIFDRLAENPFRPMAGASNAHLQTILPRLVRRRVTLKAHWQRLTLPDGDFVDLAWSENPARARNKPRVVLFHGLEGSFHSPYAHGLLQALKARGWLGVVMHFRGCSGVPNRLNRIYHSGETGDASYFLQWLRAEWGRVPTAAVGFSLGGNMLACLLGKQGDHCLLDAAVAVSAPLMLEPCSRRLEQGFSRVYQRYLLNLLKQNARRKLHAWPGTLPVDLAQLESIGRLRDFDNAITARAHGFIDASDYYRRSSAMPLLPGVRKPLLIIHAQDDPFMTADVIPDPALLPSNVEYQLTQHGGHVGFVGGTLRSPQMWLEQRIPQWLTTWLDN